MLVFCGSLGYRVLKGYNTVAVPSSGEFSFGKLHRKFVETDYGKIYGTFEAWEDAASFRSTLETLEIYDQFKDMVDLRAAKVKMGAIFANLKMFAAKVMLNEDCQFALDNALLLVQFTWHFGSDQTA